MCAQETVREIREAIFAATQLTASAGIACNGRLAKVCSDRNKPNGQYALPRDRATIQDFMSKLPIRKVSGIGKVSERELNAFGVTTCQHLLDQRGTLKLVFSQRAFFFFLRVALGVQRARDAEDATPRKSISLERTFADTAVRSALVEKTREVGNAGWVKSWVSYL